MPALADIFGISGVSLILLAFFLNLFGRIRQDAYSYIIMNLVGGILACISSVLIQPVAFTILEGTWAMVSAVALVKKYPINNPAREYTGETDLTKLIRQMAPRLNEGMYVFCHVTKEEQLPTSEVLAAFREAEGLSVILPQSAADRSQVPYSFRAAWITLDIHSALEAVGLTAAAAAALAEAGISCNVVAAFFHDHIFVQEERAEEALAILNKLSRTYSC